MRGVLCLAAAILLAGCIDSLDEEIDVEVIDLDQQQPEGVGGKDSDTVKAAGRGATTSLAATKPKAYAMGGLIGHKTTTTSAGTATTDLDAAQPFSQERVGLEEANGTANDTASNSTSRRSDPFTKTYQQGEGEGDLTEKTMPGTGPTTKDGEVADPEGAKVAGQTQKNTDAPSNISQTAEAGGDAPQTKEGQQTTTTTSTTATTTTSSTTTLACTKECYEIRIPTPESCQIGCCISENTRCQYVVGSLKGTGPRCRCW
jgi:hypothetical protein